MSAYECAEIRDVRAEENSAVFYISPLQGNRLITLEITVPRPDILGVKLSRFKDAMPQMPSFTLLPLDFEETATAYTVRAGKIAAILQKGRFSISFTYDGKILASEADELVYGREPFYLSNKGYGMFVSYTEDEHNFCIIGGGSPKAAVANYRALSGSPPLPQSWSFGPWLTVSLCAEYDEGKANQLAGGLAGVSLSAVQYERIWSKKEFPVHWLDTPKGTFIGMADILREGLSFSAGGTDFWGHDIGGIDASPDVYKRWIAFGMFSTHARLRSARSNHAPWEQDKETIKVLRHFAKTKNALLPYLFGQAVKAAQIGIPVVRPMVMEYPDDPLCHRLELQYMLGGGLLAAPVFFEDGHCDVYLPDGMFTNFFTGEVVAGGRLIRGVYNYMTMPVFVPENTLLPLSRSPDCDYHENVTVHAYRLTEQTLELYDKNGVLRATVTGRAHGEEVTFQVDGDAPGLMFEVRR
jgi:alpha-glucosidase (family GH31 glycosyl hydrolase)